MPDPAFQRHFTLKELSSVWKLCLGVHTSKSASGTNVIHRQEEIFGKAHQLPDEQLGDKNIGIRPIPLIFSRKRQTAARKG